MNTKIFFKQDARRVLGRDIRGRMVYDHAAEYFNITLDGGDTPLRLGRLRLIIVSTDRYRVYTTRYEGQTLDNFFQSPQWAELSQMSLMTCSQVYTHRDAGEDIIMFRIDFMGDNVLFCFSRSG